jgi:hypothetical protein
MNSRNASSKRGQRSMFRIMSHTRRGAEPTRLLLARFPNYLLHREFRRLALSIRSEIALPRPTMPDHT